MILWDGSCIVHEEFKAKGILDLKKVYPDAAILVHPESPDSVVEIADFVGSTSQIISAAKRLSNENFIVATDAGIFYKMNQMMPGKNFYIAPTAGSGATCRSCANCPWMAMNELRALDRVLSEEAYRNQCEIHIDPHLGERAKLPLDRMLAFQAR